MTEEINIEELLEHYNEIAIKNVNDNLVFVDLCNTEKRYDFIHIIFENYGESGRVYVIGDRGSCTFHIYGNTLKTFSSKDYKPDYRYMCDKIVSFDVNRSLKEFDIPSTKKNVEDFFGEDEQKKKRTLEIFEEHINDNAKYDNSVYVELDQIETNDYLGLCECISKKYSYDAKYICACVMIAANKYLGY